jgi:hypothetical protein
MTTPNDKHTTPPDLLERAAAGEAAEAAIVSESKHRLLPRCPECGAMGSLELIDGVERCIDCDEVVAATRKLEGFGRR